VYNPKIITKPVSHQKAHPIHSNICQRLDKHPLEIAFPTVFIATLRLLANLPKRLQVALGKRLARTSDGKPS